MGAYSVVVTSCNRFDLLEKTLETLLPRLDGNLQEIIVAEDSGKEEVNDVVARLGKEIRVILNRPQLGQLASIDRAYATVKTPYIFHCEDDWDFFGDDFITPSIELLEAFPAISMVSLRPKDELHPKERIQPERIHNGIRYMVADPDAHPEYFGYSFNPGMRRLADYHRMGPFCDYRGEREISYCFKQLGQSMAYLQPPAVRHSGWGRHVDDPKQEKRLKSFSGRLKKSAGLRLARLKRVILPFTDPAYQLKRGVGPFAESRIARRKSA